MNRSAKLCLALSLAAAPASAQTDRSPADAHDANALTNSLTEILSLVTLGAITTRQEAAQVTRSGADYLVRLPLTGLSAPADAAVTAVAHPLDDGMWDVSSMMLPPTETVEPTLPNATAARITYALGKQTIHLLVDPNLVRPSSLAADLGDVRVRTDQTDRHSEQSFEHYVMDGTVSAQAAGDLNIASHGKATNWHLKAQGPNNLDIDGLVRAFYGRFSVEGLDRAQGTRLLAAGRALTAQAQSLGRGEPASPAQHADLRALVDAIPGLLTSFQAEETLEDVRFTAGPDKGGSMGRLHLNMAGDAVNERVNARLEIGMDELTIAAVSPDTAAYVPRHLDIKAAMAGVRTQALMMLLRAATEPDADPAALQDQFMALLGDADARIGIESVTFDSGPMRVTGSARVVPRANGQLGAEIHLTATGLDAFITQAQGKPALQQVLPVVFIAKGMGRLEGGAVTWDIALGDGPVTINGMPLGQPNARTR